MNTQHTPTPWIDETASNPLSSTDGRHYIWSDMDNENDKCVAIVPDEANAAFIVRACNAHDELVATMRQIVIEATESPNCDAVRVALILQQARAALAKAGAA